MYQTYKDTIQCPNSEHANDAKLVCIIDSCKADRLYCIQCIREGIHVSHPQHQQELPFLFENIQTIEKECDDVITKLNKQLDIVYQNFQVLIRGISLKYQKSKQAFLTQILNK